MDDGIVGGWVLTLTCRCGAVEEFRGVVPQLALDRAAAAHWQAPGGRLTAWTTTREGTCGPCRARRVA